MGLWSAQRRPRISKTTEQAIQLGLNLPHQASISTLKDWLAQLPDVAAISSKSSPEESLFPLAAKPETTSDWLTLRPDVTASSSKSLLEEFLFQPATKPKTTSETQPKTPRSKTARTIKADFALPPQTAPLAAPSQAATSTPPPTGRAPDLPAPAQSPIKSVKRGRQIRKVALLMTVFVSALMGLGFGTVLRFSPASQSGGIRFDPDQSFPPLEDWLEDQPSVNFEAPYLPSERSLADQTDVSRTDAAQTGAVQTGPQPIENPDSKEKEFKWLDQESIIPDYPTPKQPSAPPTSWSTYPESVSPPPPVQDPATSTSPNTAPSPSTAPTLSSLIETLPVTDPSDTLSNEVGASFRYSPGPGESTLPIPDSPATIEPPSAVFEITGESLEGSNSPRQN